MNIRKIEDKGVLRGFFHHFGFTNLAFPLGNAKNGKHSAGCAYYEIIDGKLFFLLIPFDKKKSIWDRPTSKETETPQETALRKFREKTNLRVEETAIEKNFTFTVENDNESNGAYDIHFLVINKCTGTPFDWRRKNHRNIRLREIGTPFLVEYRIALTCLKKIHKKAIKKIVSYLRKKGINFIGILDL